MPVIKTRYDQLHAAAVKCWYEHPEVWVMFCKFTQEKIDAGFKHFGTNTIFGRIRYETPAGDDGLVAFKLSNNHAPFYARGFMDRFPEHEGFFHLRKQTSRDQPPVMRPELGPSDYPEVTR